jgi:hypothetical protein
MTETALIVHEPIDRTVTLYDDRAVFLATIAKFVKAQGGSVGISYGQDPEGDPLVVFELPSGQVSWWVHEDELFLFSDTADKYNGDVEPIDGVERLVRLLKFGPKPVRKRKPRQNPEIA